MRLNNIKWSNLVFFTLSPIVAVLGGQWVIQHRGLHPATVVWSLVLLVAVAISTTAGYHRLFSHRSYQASWPLRLFFVLFGGAALQGSVRWWCQEHRIHHRFVDTDKDPYGINKGFWYAHMGWLLTKDHDLVKGYGNIKDLEADPIVRFQDRYIFFVAIGMGFLFPMGIASLWGDPWGGLVFAGLARVVINHQSTFCINSFAHFIGRQTYSDKSSARDSWITAVLTNGEGYHNFHHEFQADYRNGVRPYHWDPTKWIINGLAWSGLAKNLRRYPAQRILAARLQMDQKRLLARAGVLSHSIDGKLHEIISSTRDHLQQAYDRFLSLKEEYRRFKSDILREEIRKAKQEFRAAMSEWRAIVNGSSLAPTHS